MPREDTQFKPGQSGNPNGRPKGSKDGLLAVLRRIGADKAWPEVRRIMEQRGVPGLNSEGNDTNNYALGVLTLLDALQGDKDARRDFMNADKENREIEVEAGITVNVMNYGNNTPS